MKLKVSFDWQFRIILSMPPVSASIISSLNSFARTEQRALVLPLRSGGYRSHATAKPTLGLTVQGVVSPIPYHFS
jgi:hypothetical protein